MVDGGDIDSLIHRMDTAIHRLDTTEAEDVESVKLATDLRSERDRLEAIRENTPEPPPPPEPPASEAPARFLDSTQPVRPVKMLTGVREHFGNPTIDVLRTSSWGWFPDTSVRDASWINIVRVHYEPDRPPRTYGDVWYCVDGGKETIEAWQDEGVDISRILSF